MKKVLLILLGVFLLFLWIGLCFDHPFDSKDPFRYIAMILLPLAFVFTFIKAFDTPFNKKVKESSPIDFLTKGKRLTKQQKEEYQRRYEAAKKKVREEKEKAEYISGLKRYMGIWYSTLKVENEDLCEKIFAQVVAEIKGQEFVSHDEFVTIFNRHLKSENRELYEENKLLYASSQEIKEIMKEKK